MTAPDNAPSPAATPRSVAVLYGIFFLSGFCGLIYESIWSHYLKLLLGHAAYAQAVVLVVFVGGLAIGAWLTGRVSERIRRPVRAYALVEAIVALLAKRWLESGPIDINNASTAQLETLPGIGPDIARAIVKGRPYANVDDLEKVNGIGPVTLEKIRPRAIVK